MDGHKLVKESNTKWIFSNNFLTGESSTSSRFKFLSKETEKKNAIERIYISSGFKNLFNIY